jgi:pimeloyl-ACP methyl ester carboxylesterase
VQLRVGGDSELQSPFEGTLETEAGPTFVRLRGNGPRLLVFHGGPGFDHEPLIDGLSDLMDHRTLVFFDQLGCGRTPATVEPVTAQATFDHAAAVVDAIGPEPVGAVAHSWGSVVAAATASLRPDFAFTESLIISPVALDGTGYGHARNAMAGRIPPDVTQRVMAMIAAGADSAEAFSLITPYYVASPKTVLPPMPVAAAVYVSVDASLDDFDYSDTIPRFGPISIIRGDSDYVDPATIGPWLVAAQRDMVMDHVGHYPFFEDAAGFAAAIRQVFGEAESEP